MARKKLPRNETQESPEPKPVEKRIVKTLARKPAAPKQPAASPKVPGVFSAGDRVRQSPDPKNVGVVIDAFDKGSDTVKVRWNSGDVKETLKEILEHC
jgi:hypothetical protein